MKIIVITTSFSLGGAEKHGFLLADYFKNVLNLNVELWVFREKTNVLKHWCEQKNIKTKIIGEVSKFYLKNKKPKKEVFFKDFLKFKPDMIISFNREANLFNAFLWEKVGAKISIWSQQSTLDNQGFANQEKVAMKNISAFISNSVHGKEYLINEFNINSQKVFVVPNGINLNRKALNSTSFWKEKLAIKKEHFSALMIGHFAERKDHSTIIKSWKYVVQELEKENINPKLYLAGSFGNDGEKLAELCVEEGVANYVNFLGKVNDIIGINKVMDIGILSSHREGMPNALIEQMFCGLPIVASNIPGNAEALGKKNKKYLSEIENPKDLAKKIINFANDSELREKVGKFNSQYARENFSQDDLGENTFSIIKLIMNK